MAVSKPWHIILNLIDACLLVHKIAVLSLFPEQLSSYCYGRAWNFQGEPHENSAMLEQPERDDVDQSSLLCSPTLCSQENGNQSVPGGHGAAGIYLWVFNFASMGFPGQGECHSPSSMG